MNRGVIMGVLIAAATCLLPVFAAAQGTDNWTTMLSPPPGEGPVAVHVAFHLLDINEIDDEAETFQFSGVLTLRWKDPRQAFDPAEAGTQEKIYTGEYQFNEVSPSWYPQVVLVNASGMFEKYGTAQRVGPDGTCTLVETINAMAESKLDLRRYPYDRQRLDAIFLVLGFDAREVTLVVEPAALTVTKREVRIPQWRFNGMHGVSREVPIPYAGLSGTASAFILSFDVQRQRLFIVRLLVIPLIFIVALSWSVFWMERSSLGDRMSVSFVGILAAVTYQIVIGGILPKISYHTPIHAFLNFSFCLMCLTVVINLVVDACDKAGKHELGDRIDRRCRWCFPLVYAGLLAGIVGIAYLSSPRFQ